MTPLRALITAATLVATLLMACDSAFARGNHRHGYHHHGPSVNFSLGYWGGPRYWGAGYGPGYWGGSGYWGSGYWGPGYWGPPVGYATPPVVMVPQEPRVWVENDQAAAAPPPAQTAPVDSNAQQWWYWCASARSYYPYVASCAEGWQRVTPQPSQGAR